MVQVVLAFTVMIAAVFYILFKAPQADVQAPAQTASAAATVSVPPSPSLAASKPTTETCAAPASVSAVPEPAVVFAPVAASSMTASTLASAAKS